DGQHYMLFGVSRTAGCPAPSARYQMWDFSFLNARRSSFRRVHLPREPMTGVTNVPIRVGGDYVSCPHRAAPPRTPRLAGLRRGSWANQHFLVQLVRSRFWYASGLIDVVAPFSEARRRL